MTIGIGIELGPAAVRALVLEQTGQGVRLLAAQDVAADTSNSETLTAAFNQLRQTLRITVPIVLGIPSTSAILTTVSPLVANPKRAELAVQFELQQHVPFELAESAWHYRWLSSKNGTATQTRARPAGKFGVRDAEFGMGTPRSTGAVVAAIKQSLLDERLACCRRAGLSVRAVAVNSVAALNAWSLKRANPSGAILLNLLSEQIAEWIVWTSAALQVVPVTSPSPEGFWEELAASWGTLRPQSGGAQGSVWVIGSPEAISRLQERGVPVERFDAAQAAVAGTSRLEHPERCVAALGLALQGLGLVRLPLNLLSDAQDETRFQQVGRIASITSGLCVVAIAGLGLSGMMEIRHRRARILESLERKERLYQTLRPEVRALIQRQQRTEQRSAQMERLVVDGPALAQVLAQIADALPDDAWLTTFECSKDGLITGQLEGRAKSFSEVTQLTDRLKSVAGMTTVKPLSTNIITDQPGGKEMIGFAIQVQRPTHQPQ